MVAAVEQNGKPGDIYRLIPEIMRRVGGVAKGRKNQQQGYSFRGIDDIYNACQPVMAELGVFVVPAVIKRENFERETAKGGTLFYTRLEVQHTFYAGDGSCVVAVTVGEAMDSGDKSANKAMAAASKYAFIETFSLPTAEDKDTENDSPQPLPARQPQRQAPPPRNMNPATGEVTLASKDQVREIKELLNLVRLPEGTTDKWFAQAGVDVWEDMPADRIANAIKFVKGRMPGGDNGEKTVAADVASFAEYGDLMDDDIFQDAVVNELYKRDFTDADCIDAQASACRAEKVTGIDGFTLPRRHEFIMAIRAGFFDRFKLTPAERAKLTAERNKPERPARAVAAGKK